MCPMQPYLNFARKTGRLDIPFSPRFQYKFFIIAPTRMSRLMVAFHRRNDYYVVVIVVVVVAVAEGTTANLILS